MHAVFFRMKFDIMKFNNWEYSENSIAEGSSSSCHECFNNDYPDGRYLIKKINNKKYHLYYHEVENLKKIRGVKGIPDLIEYGEDNEGYFCIIMSYLEGETLSEFIRNRGPMSIAEATLFIDKMLQILCSSHDQGVVHLDLGQKNIIVNLPDVGIIDWGGSKHISDNIDENFWGNKYTSAPEIFYGVFSYETDFYALAILFHYALTGNNVFDFEIRSSQYGRNALSHCLEKPSINKNIPIEFKRVIYQWLRKSADNRNISYSISDTLTNATGSPDDFQHAWYREKIYHEIDPYIYGSMHNIPCYQVRHCHWLIENEHIVEAEFWLKKAVDLNYAPALRVLAELNLNREGIGQASDQTMSYLHKAAHSNDKQAAYLMLNEFFINNDIASFEENITLLERAAYFCERDANHLLAKYYHEKKNNINKARSFYKTAALLGNKDAQQLLTEL